MQPLKQLVTGEDVAVFPAAADDYNPFLFRSGDSRQLFDCRLLAVDDDEVGAPADFRDTAITAKSLTGVGARADFHGAAITTKSLTAVASSACAVTRQTPGARLNAP